ncbi:MAG: penicillin acylase family protein, partial [Chloroflexi bacterium]
MLGLVSPVSALAAGCQTVTGPAGGPYADCGGGQVYNILPPGENGLVNAATAATRQPPPHGDDQRSMYADLVRVAPHLQPADLGRYFKQAGLSVSATDVERAYSPRAGTVIVRDRSFGVAHVFGATRADTEFGSGYAAAEDRLFMMDVFRHIGRSTLSSFLGPSQTALALDCEVARVAGYNDAELQAQIDALPQRYPQPFDATHSEGQQVVADGLAYIDGVNAYLNQALVNPTLLPAEYPALQVAPVPFKPTDIIAIATLVQAIFAVGGGSEVDSALFYSSLVQRYGAAKGSAIWHDFRSQNDPGAQVTLSGAFPYMPVPASVDPNSLAVPVSQPSTTMCDGGPLPAANPGLGQISVAGLTIDLSAILRPNRSASNAILVSEDHTASGHPIAVFGPQVAYFAPEILHEVDLHGPHLNARGATFIGTDIYVELGRGADYSWSATSAGSDIIDQRLEKLCDPAGGAPTLRRPDPREHRLRLQRPLHLDVRADGPGGRQDQPGLAEPAGGDHHPDRKDGARAGRGPDAGHRPGQRRADPGRRLHPALDLRRRAWLRARLPGVEQPGLHAFGCGLHARRGQGDGDLQLVLRGRTGHRLLLVREDAGAARDPRSQLPDLGHRPVRVAGIPARRRQPQRSPSTCGQPQLRVPGQLEQQACPGLGGRGFAVRLRAR